MKWLLDTNVISEQVRLTPNKSVMAWLENRLAEQLAVSRVTMAELCLGIRSTSRRERRAELTRWLEEEIQPLFAERTLDVSVDILIDWIGIGRKLAARGRTRSPADLLLASTARVHDLIIVSRNFRHFEGTGTVVYNPWTEQMHAMDAP